MGPGAWAGTTEIISKHESMFSRRDAPECWLKSRPSKMRGAGKAGYTLHPRSRVHDAQSKSAHEHTGSAEALRLSLRNGLTAYAVLAPATNSFLSPSLTDYG